MTRWIRNILLAFFSVVCAAAAPAFQARGYYMTFMRMPMWGLPQWRAAIDCMEEDGANVLLLWTAGGFRSKKFPITWEYNREHPNVQADFARELINYAHSKKIRVLLGFTPFGYDGVNQYSIEHPDLKARKADGSPVDAFGIHCWGWSLCPAREGSQTFMLEYIREMFFDFYPNADGLLIESSDYDVCQCPKCGPKYYENEFAFVRKISGEIWAAKKDATIIVYPHYFSGKKANAGSSIESQAAGFDLDKRWALFFTPHSAHLDPALIARAGWSYFWSDTPSLGTPGGIRAAAIKAQEHKVTGFTPSLEPFSYPLPRQEFGHGKPGQRVKQLGFDWLADDAMALTNLPARLQRFAFREYSQDPQLGEADFRKRAAAHFFNDEDSPAIDALFFIQRCINTDRNWSHSSPLVDPAVFQEKAAGEKWSPEKRKTYERDLARLREIASATNSVGPTAELKSIAEFITSRWQQGSAAHLLQR